MAKKSLKKNWLNKYKDGTEDAQPTLTFATRPVGTINVGTTADNTSTTVNTPSGQVSTGYKTNANVSPQMSKQVAEAQAQARGDRSFKKPIRAGYAVESTGTNLSNPGANPSAVTSTASMNAPEIGYVAPHKVSIGDVVGGAITSIPLAAGAVAAAPLVENVMAAPLFSGAPAWATIGTALDAAAIPGAAKAFTEGNYLEGALSALPVGIGLAKQAGSVIKDGYNLFNTEKRVAEIGNEANAATRAAEEATTATSGQKPYAFKKEPIPAGAEGQVHRDAVDIVNREYNTALKEAAERNIPVGAYNHPDRPSMLVADQVGHDYVMPEGMTHDQLNQVALRFSGQKFSPQEANTIVESLVAHNPELRGIVDKVNANSILNGVASNVHPNDIVVGHNYFENGIEPPMHDLYDHMGSLQEHLPENRGLGDFFYSPESLEKIKNLTPESFKPPVIETPVTPTETPRFNLQRQNAKPKSNKYHEVIEDPNFQISKSYGTPETPRDISIKGKSGYWNATRNPSTGNYNFSANMSNPMEAGRAISRMNELLPPKPVILEPNSFSLDSYNALLNMSRRPEWDMEHVGHIDLNNSAIHNNFLKHLTGGSDASSVLNDTRYFKNKQDAEEGLRLVNEFLSKKGMPHKAKLSMPFGTRYGIQVPNYKLSRKYEYGGTISHDELYDLGDLVHKIQYLPMKAYGGNIGEQQYANSLVSQNIEDNPRKKLIAEEMAHLNEVNKELNVPTDHSFQIRKIKLINALSDLAEGKDIDETNKRIFVVDKPKAHVSNEGREANDHDEIEIVYNPKTNKNISLTKNAADNGIFAAFADAVSEYKEMYPGRPLPRITSGIRTRAEQEHLYNNRENTAYPVAKPGTSKHELGKALDIVFDGGNDQDYKNLAELMKKRGVKWLGNYDKVHFETDETYPKVAYSGNNVIFVPQNVDSHLKLNYPTTRSFKEGGIIDDNMGQWAHPGKVTRIHSNDITMKGVPYPVLGVGADGEQRMMYPNEEHTFNQAPVTEYPMMQAKDGGQLTHYQNAGPVVKPVVPPDIMMDPTKLAQWMKDHPENRATAPAIYHIPPPEPKPVIVNVDPRLVTKVKPPMQPVIHQGSTEVYKPSEEELVDNYLGNPQFKARVMAESEPGEDPYDNVRHSFAGRYTAEALTNTMDNALGKSILTRNPIVQGATAALGAIGSAELGLGHEASTYFVDPRWSEDHDRYGNPMPWYKRAYTITREGLEDEFNNSVGATIGASPFISNEEKDTRLWNLINNDYLPDGYGENNIFGPNSKGAYRNIEQRKHGGLLNQYQSGGTAVSADDEKYAKFVQTLPDNLKNNDDRYYNLRGYWESLGKPEAFDYSQPKEEDGYYHAFSRNPNTGEILKKPGHPTFKYALEEDAKEGYNAYISPDGTVYTFGKDDVIPEGFKPYKYKRGGVTWLNEYAQGGEVFSAGGEKHKVYKKESPTGNGKGVKGDIMVTHPTTDKGKWDTIDLTKIAGAKTVAQGVAATKKWHEEHPEYKPKKKLKTRK